MGSAAAILGSLGEAVRAAGRTAEPLCIEGGNTKSFYGRMPRGKRLSIAELRGILAYEPTELVITAWAGTPLTEIERTLAEHGQMLAFEPPHFGPGATLGGMLACALSGPRRPYAGGMRDSVLGLACITGAGEVLRFGGQVMKNVAGFDVSRLMAGAMGTLGIVVEASIRVLPVPETELTRRQAMSEEQALERMNAWAGQPLPLSAACFDGRELFVRLSGHGAAVAAARKAIGGLEVDDARRFWTDLREQRLPFFADNRPLWRVSVPPATVPLKLEGAWFVDWGGAQRWLKTELPAESIRALAKEQGGHAVLFRGGDREEVFAPLSPGADRLHRRLKQAFDPRGIFNPGRLYSHL